MNQQHEALQTLQKMLRDAFQPQEMTHLMMLKEAVNDEPFKYYIFMESFPVDIAQKVIGDYNRYDKVFTSSAIQDARA